MKTKILARALGALFLFAFGLWSSGLMQKLEAARVREAALAREVAETRAALEYVAEDRRRTVAALEAVHRAEKARANALNAALKEIDHAPESDDGPVAPVLRRALGSLRQ